MYDLQLSFYPTLLLILVLNYCVYRTYKNHKRFVPSAQQSSVNSVNYLILLNLVYLIELVLYFLLVIYEALFGSVSIEPNLISLIIIFLLNLIILFNLTLHKNLLNNSLPFFISFVVFIFDSCDLIAYFAQPTGNPIRFVRVPLSALSLSLSIYELFFLRKTHVMDIENNNTQDQREKYNLIGKLKKLSPYLIPRTNSKLSFMIVGSYVLLVIGRIVNVLVPLQYKLVVDSLSKNEDGVIEFAWSSVVVYVVLRFLQGGSGLVQSVQNFVLIPINQYTTKKISLEMFEHLHSLSLDYHIKRKTGEVIRVMDRGTSSIVSLMNYIVFQIFPVLTDISVAIVFFWVKFDYKYGIVVFLSMLTYTYITIKITEWRNEFRRKMNEFDNKTTAIAVDSLINFETVKYYGNERFELKRYTAAIETYLKHDFLNSSTLPLLNLTQNLMITAGLLVGSLLCADEVAKGKLTVGDFVLFLAYLTQLYVPLNFFGTYYRMIQRNFIDMENMFALFEINSDVSDLPDSYDINITEGPTIEFKNVFFSYNDNKNLIQNLNLSIPGGKKIALVGPSGGGKSTILKLLFRFYEIQEGEITINNTNIRNFTQESLRKQIGVVPQDTVLFNETIKYNIRYGNVDATDEDVQNASKSAQIHDKIIAFQNGYDTVVGERGLRLSGGEKQRVAIARTILKSPNIVFLDEATSSLDMSTENEIMKVFETIFEGKTTITIAHRLSTIKNSDLIICIDNGTVVEQGAHEELMNNNGIYQHMWESQKSNSQ